MPTNVEVPALGESVREAVLIKWHKNDGDAVAAQEPICELETDKANVDDAAPGAGNAKPAVSKTAAAGATTSPGGAGYGGQVATAARPQAAPSPVTAPPAAASAKPEDFRPSVRKMVDEKKVNPADLKGTGPRGMVTKEDAVRAASGGPGADDVADDAPR